MSRARRARPSGHRDRKQIKFSQIRRPIVAADRRAAQEGKPEHREHRAGLDAFARRVLGLDKQTAEDRA